MNSFFSEIGIRALDFIQISTLFVLTMAVFFGVKDKKYAWLNYFLLLTFILHCMFFMLFGHEINVKLFAALMLISVVTVEAVVSRTRKMESMEP
jgi:hypothetical protein